MSSIARFQSTRTRAAALLASALTLGACAQTPAAPAPVAATAPTAVAPSPQGIPLVLPRTELVYEAIAELAPTLDLGTGPLGERRMVPITGGTFEGPRLRGRVLPGGADRQLLRKDGARMLDALYEMQTDDGAIITVHNQVMTRPDGPGKDDRFSHVTLTAPEGKYSWVNQSVYVGTLHSLRPRPAVLIRVYRLY